MRHILKKYKIFILLYSVSVMIKQFFKFRIIAFFSGIHWFTKDYFKYSRQNTNPHYTFRFTDILPLLIDKTSYTPVEPMYFYQDTWAASLIFKNHPAHHYDIGSSVMTMAVLSQYVPLTMIDIRPIELKLTNLNFLKGSILSIPLAENSIESLSSLCVVEHIGLGRYGDAIDPFGSEKAIKELQRVLKPGGNLYISVPVDNEAKICFNAHRTFTRDSLLQLFHNFILVEERYQYKNTLYVQYDPQKGFGTGLFYFRKK